MHELRMKYKGKKMAPAYNAFHTFLFTPNDTTHGGTHVKGADDLKRTMNTVITALLPVLLFSMFNAGYQHYSAINGFPADFSLMEHFITWIIFLLELPKFCPWSLFLMVLAYR